MAGKRASVVRNKSGFDSLKKQTDFCFDDVKVWWRNRRSKPTCWRYQHRQRFEYSDKALVTIAFVRRRLKIPNVVFRPKKTATSVKRRNKMAVLLPGFRLSSSW